MGHGFSESTIGRSFNGLVNKSDYSQEDRDNLIRHFVNLSSFVSEYPYSKPPEKVTMPASKG